MSPGPQESAARCIDLVELLTAYLDGALTDDMKNTFDEHLQDCAGCRAALTQWRTVSDLAARLNPADVATLDPYLRQRFLTALATVRRK
jgi:anti-sigma factor RsiW